MTRHLRPWLADLVPALALVLLASATLMMPSGLEAMRHSISESAAQATPWAWIGRIGLAAFGLAAWLAAGRLWPTERATGAALAVFGLAMIASAAWSHRPWLPDVPFDAGEDAIHSLAAQTAGLAIAAAVVSHIVSRIRAGSPPGRLDWLALAAVIIGSVGFAWFPAASGLLQRAMFAAILLWLWRIARRRL